MPNRKQAMVAFEMAPRLALANANGHEEFRIAGTGVLGTGHT